MWALLGSYFAEGFYFIQIGEGALEFMLQVHDRRMHLAKG